MNLIGLLAAAVTSLLAGIFLKKARLLSAASLLQAGSAFLDWLGLFAVFAAANAAIGLLAVFAIRGFTPWFVSAYDLEDILLFLFSAVQAFIFTYLYKRR